MSAWVRPKIPATMVKEMLRAKRDSYQSPDAPRCKRLAKPPAKKPAGRKPVAKKPAPKKVALKKEKKTQRRGQMKTINSLSVKHTLNIFDNFCLYEF